MTILLWLCHQERRKDSPRRWGQETGSGWGGAEEWIKTSHLTRGQRIEAFPQKTQSWTFKNKDLDDSKQYFTITSHICDHHWNKSIAKHKKNSILTALVLKRLRESGRTLIFVKALEAKNHDYLSLPLLRRCCCKWWTQKVASKQNRQSPERLWAGRKPKHNSEAVWVGSWWVHFFFFLEKKTATASQQSGNMNTTTENKHVCSWLRHGKQRAW